MMKLISALSMMVLIGVLTSTAQMSDESDLESLFTANVHIVDYRLSSKETEMYDNAARLLLISGHSYAYPEEIQSVYHVQPGANGDFLVEVLESLPDTAGATHFWVWSFAPQTGLFTHLTPLCGHPSRLTVADLDNPWVYVTDSATGGVYLCEAATGHLSQPLPSGQSWDVQPPFTTEALPVFTSTDGQWLLLFSQTDHDTRVFSYNTTTANLTEIGVLTCHFCVEWHSVRWFDTTAILWSVDESRHAIYSMDINQPGSLELVLTRPQYLLEFYDNPPRYDYMNFTTPENIWDTQCEHVIYDIQSHHKTVTDMGSLCRPEQGTLDGIGYYRDVTRGGEGIAALTRFDARTQESEVLYEGEIELIAWVSPDEHYAAVVLDSSGHIDTPPFQAPLFNWGVPEAPTLAYVDLVTDKIIFADWTGWNWCDLPLGGPDWNWNAGLSDTRLEHCSHIGPTGAILPRGDNTFLVIGNKEPQYAFFNADPTEFADLITVQGDNIDRVRIAEGELTPFNSEYVLSQTWDENQTPVSHRFSLISTDGSPAIPITNAIVTDTYHLSAWAIDPSANQIVFYVSPDPQLEKDWWNAFVTIQVDMP